MSTILAVDDERQIAAIAGDFLRQAGFEVITAHDGETALRLARSGTPALMVLDLRLPGMDGFDVARLLRLDSPMPIIMLTARVEESDRLRGLDIGADDYIARVFDRFYKGPRSTGSGLGLTIARNLVLAHGGDLTATSALGRGTTMTVTLPTAIPADPSSPSGR